MKYWKLGGETRGDAYFSGLQSVLAGMQNDVLETGLGNDKRSGGTSASQYAQRYPLLATASAIHNLQLLQMMVSGLEIECFMEYKLPDGKKGKLVENLPRVVKCPLPWDESYTFGNLSAQAMAGDVLCGEIWIYKHITKGNKLAGVEILPNHWCKRDDETASDKIYEIDCESYRPYVRSGYYTSKNITHIITRPVLGYHRGVGAQQMATPSVISALMVDVFSAKYYKNALSLGGIIRTKGKTQKEIKAIEEELAKKFKGIEDAHRWLVMNSDEMDAKALSPTPANAHLIRANERAAIDMGKMTGVPPTEANESIVGTLSYAIAGAHRVSMATNRLQPFCKLLAEGINRNSAIPILPRGKKIRFVLDDLLRGDERTRAQMMKELVKSSIMAPNVANRLMEYPTYEGEQYENPIAPSSWGTLKGEADVSVPPEKEDIDEEEVENMISGMVDRWMEENRNGYPELNGYINKLDEFFDYNIEV